MVDLVRYLSDIAHVKYLRYMLPPAPPGILKPELNGAPHDLVLLHSHNINQLFPARVNNKLFRPMPEHSHPQAHIVLYTAGETTGRYCGRKYAAKRGLLLLISPNEPHLFDPPSDPGKLEAFEISFFFMAGKQPSLVPFHVWFSALSGMDIPQLTSPVLLDEAQTCQLIGLHEKLMSRWERRGPLVWFGVHSIMLDIFAFFLEDVYCVGALKNRDTREQRIIRARDSINCRYNEPLKLGDLAKMTYLSAPYFCRQFKKKFGVTPVAYLYKQRILAAKTLLRATGMTIKEIAGQIGYGDIYSFSKAFRRFEGVSPAVYRKRGKNAGGINSTQLQPWNL